MNALAEKVLKQEVQHSAYAHALHSTYIYNMATLFNNHPYISISKIVPTGVPLLLM